VKSKWRPQQSDPPTQSLSLRNIEDPNWEWEVQQVDPGNRTPCIRVV
jgi:hypothetical protein